MSQRAKIDKPVRVPVLPGAIVVVVTLLGADSAFAASMTLDRAHRATSIVARSMVPSNATGTARSSHMTWAAASLIVLLVLGRQVLSVVPRPTVVGLVPLAGAASTVPLLRRKSSISYHIGGSHGP